MRLNLDRIQRAAEKQRQEALNDSGENSGLAPFKRPNSGHRGYLSLSCVAKRYVFRTVLSDIADLDRLRRDRLPIDPPWRSRRKPPGLGRASGRMMLA